MCTILSFINLTLAKTALLLILSIEEYHVSP